MLYENNRTREARDEQKVDSSDFRKAASDYYKDKRNKASQKGQVGQNKAPSESGEQLSHLRNKSALDGENLASEKVKKDAAKAAAKKAAEMSKDVAKAGAEVGGAAAASSAKAGASAAAAGGEAAAAGGEAAAAGGEVAAGAATGPGVIIVLILEAIKLLAKRTKNEIASVEELGTLDADYKPSIHIIAPIIAIILFMGMAYNHNETASGVWGYHENEYSEAVAKDQVTFAINKADFVDEDGLFDATKYLAEASKVYRGDHSKGLIYCMDQAISSDLIKEVKELGRWSFGRWWNNYNEDKTLEILYNNPWPYDLAKDETMETPKIGNILEHFGKSTGFEAMEPSYDDVNFAEIISILCMNPKFDLSKIKFDDFITYMTSEENRKYYYEMEVTWYAHYKHLRGLNPDGTPAYDTIDEQVSSEDDIENVAKRLSANGKTYTFEYYYASTTIKPFGLRELFLLAEVEPFDYPPQDDNHFHGMTWYEQLDRMEERLRFGCGKDDADTILGPSYAKDRSERSFIYEDLINLTEKATGRSAWYYIGNSANMKDLQNMLLYGSFDGLTPDEIRTLFNFPEGTNILEMMDFYLNQLMLPDFNRGNSGARMNKYGCWDCTVMMITQFYTGKKMSNEEIANFCLNYVNSSGGCMYGKWYADNGISYSGFKAFNADDIKSQIDTGNPVHLRIGGHWEYEGRVLHNSSNQHSLVVSGYDEETQSFIVCDPANTSNTQKGIPYDAFVNGTGLTTLQYQTTSYNGN